MSLSIDTNVLVYTVDDRDVAKHRIARLVVDRLAEVDGLLGLQVVGEYQNALRRRLKRDARDAVAAAGDMMETFNTFGYDRIAVERAVVAVRLRQISYWDALLLASAEFAGVTALVSEDMHHGGFFGRVEIVNPFDHDRLSHRAGVLLGL